MDFNIPTIPGVSTVPNAPALPTMPPAPTLPNMAPPAMPQVPGVTPTPAPTGAQPVQPAGANYMDALRAGLMSPGGLGPMASQQTPSIPGANPSLTMPSWMTSPYQAKVNAWRQQAPSPFGANGIGSGNFGSALKNWAASRPYNNPFSGISKTPMLAGLFGGSPTPEPGGGQ